MARKCALLTLLVACAVARAAATGVTAAPFHSDRAGERASGSGSGLAAAAPVLPVVEAWAANSVRVRWPAPGYPLAESPYSPYAPQPPGAPAAVRAGDTFTNGNLAVDVSAAGLVTARRVSDGLTLLSQVSLEFGAPVLPGLPPSVEATFAGAATSEIFVGAGEQGLAGHAVLEMPFMRDFADTEYYGYNHGSQAFLPLFFSSAGYGVMVAQQGYGHLTLSRAPDVTAFNATAARVFDMWITTTPGTPVFAAGVPHPTLALLSNYADAVGHAPPVPGFATGFVASKDRYRNQTQFLDVVHGYLDRAIPLSVASACRRARGGAGAAACRPATPPLCSSIFLTLASPLLSSFSLPLALLGARPARPRRPPAARSRRRSLLSARPLLAPTPPPCRHLLLIQLSIGFTGRSSVTCR